MARNEYTRGLVSEVKDQAVALGERSGPWPKDSVDSLCKALQACALALRLDINRMLPVNGLPPEVLSHTFELACSPPSAASTALLVALTHVCRYWRVVLLSNPKFWTNIFTRRDTVDFFAECLLRSKALPVHLNLHYHMRWDGSFSCSCEDHFPLVSCGVRCPHTRARKTVELLGQRLLSGRLQSLDLLIFFPDPVTPATTFDEVRIANFFNHPLPELHSLRLVCLDAAQLWEDFPIYDGIFSRSLPKLKHLSLVQCWGGLTGWLVGLTSFHLEFRDLWDFRSDKFLAFLEGNRGTLGVLSLDNVGFDNYGGRPVTLSNLKELKLKRIADPVNLFLHLTLPAFGSLERLRVRFSDGIAAFSATNTSGALLQIVENQGDVFSCCANGLALSWWTQISTLDLDLHGSQEVSDSDVEDFYCSIPSLETMEIRTVSHLYRIFRPLLPIKRALHPSLKLVRLPVPQEARDAFFAVLVTTSHGRKAMGCAIWSMECICDESCEEVSNQWAIYCEKNGFGTPWIVKFMRDPGFLDRQRKIFDDHPTETTLIPEASDVKDPNAEVPERILANRENITSQATELIQLSKSRHTRENLSRIYEHVENMRAGISRIQNGTSSFHKLPCDLLQEIFHHSCWSDQHKVSRSAVTLSHVCCRWRVVLLSTPQFWCSITVDGHDSSFAAACLARSDNLPLDVTVQFNYTATPDEDEVGSGFNFSILENEDVRRRLDECREGLTLLVAERDRIHRLYVNYIILGSDWIGSSVPEHEFFGYALKNLQELWWYYDDKEVIWPLPSRFLGGSLESLGHLRLENVEASIGCIRNLASLEYISGGNPYFAPGGMPEFFSQNTSLQSLKISGFRIYKAESPGIYMDNLTSLTLDRITHWYLLFDLLQIKNLDGGTFAAISLSEPEGLITFSSVNSVGFSLTIAISPREDSDSREYDFIRRYLSGVTLVRLEDFQVIFNTERLFSILRVLGDSGGDTRRLELHVETEYLDTDTEITIFAKPFLPRLGTLVVYLPEWTEPWGWVEVMVEDLFNPDHHAKFPDECIFEVYYFDSGLFLSANMGELRARFEDGESYDSLISRSQRSSLV